MRRESSSKECSLFNMRRMHLGNGPSLLLCGQVHWRAQPDALLAYAGPQHFLCSLSDGFIAFELGNNCASRIGNLFKLCSGTSLLPQLAFGFQRRLFREEGT